MGGDRHDDANRSIFATLAVNTSQVKAAELDTCIISHHHPNARMTCFAVCKGTYGLCLQCIVIHCITALSQPCHTDRHCKATPLGTQEERQQANWSVRVCDKCTGHQTYSQAWHSIYPHLRRDVSW
jgi:hypothetical protein